MSEADRMAELEAENARLRERISELEKLVEEIRRGGKRQAAPFSKGEPTAEPKRAGRKSGEGHGRHGHRRVPVSAPDRELSAPLPECCPHCGGEVVHERDADQYQTDSVSASR